ncbi:MAG TPA: ABC transporter permease, partial [Blastocatellia bacterium]|nr:ABC transporter permease [Blastocatellia bacterium]
MPDWNQEIMRRLAGLKLEPTREAVIIEELSQHLDDCYDDLLSGGATPSEAYSRTLAELSDSELLSRELRRVEQQIKHEPIVLGTNRRSNMIAYLWQDLRFGARVLMKNPGFTLIAVITLALCIGANLTIFAVVDSVLLRALPFPDADRLVTVFNTYPNAGVERDGCSITNYYERRGNIAAFSEVAAYREGAAVVGEAGSTEQEHVMKVSPEFFSTVGIGPVAGRTFTDEETTYQTDGVAILTDAYWRQHFDADPDVIGREIRVDGLQKKVIGVLPPDYGFLSSKARLYFPLSSDLRDRAPERRHWGSSTNMIARLKPGVTLAEAQSQIDAHNAAVEKDGPEAKLMAEAGFHSVVVGLHADHVASIRPTLLLMQAGVLFLLLIGGVNLV